MYRLVLIAVGLLILSACSTDGIPRVTPTVAPTDTPTATDPGTPIAQVPSRTPIITLTNTDAPTSTATPSITPSATATRTPDPSETPTLTPTLTATPSNTATNTPSATPTATPTSTTTPTPDPSETPTLTPTLTATPSNTATNTPSATVTNTTTPSITTTWTPIPTNTPTVTASNTASTTPTVTPLPIIQPTATPSPSATATVTASITATAVPSPTATPVLPTVDIDATVTEIARQYYATLTASAPTATPTNTITKPPPPTLDVTPTLVTAAPLTPVPPTVEDLGIFTPEPSIPPPTNAVTFTPSPAPTVAIIVPVPPTISRDQVPGLIQPPPGGAEIGTRPFAITTGPGGGINVGGFDLGNSGTLLFARNPVDPSEYVLTNAAGVLNFRNASGIQGPPIPPYSQFIASTPQENQFYVSDVAWSSNGQYVAYIINGERHPDPTAEDGVHFVDPDTGVSRPLYRDAPGTWHPGYQIGGENREFFTRSDYVEWSPQNDAVLDRVRILNDWSDGHGALYVLTLDQNPDVQPAPLRYDYGSWSLDNNRLVVSGRRPDGRVIIGTVNRDGSGEQIILDASALGLWVQHAVQRPDRTFYALGRMGSNRGPMRIYNQNGQAITGDIGTGTPTRVEWSPDKSAVLVEADGRVYVANINGTVQDITERVGGPAVNWVSGGLPAGATETTPGSSSGDSSALPEGFVPSGVIEGSRYSARQQLRVYAAGGLNLRVAPDLEADAIGSALEGTYVAVLAGPVSFDNIEWWQVQNAEGIVGWVAVQINGLTTLGS